MPNGNSGGVGGGRSNGGDDRNIVFQVVVDAVTGNLTLKQVGQALNELGQKAQQVGQQIGGAATTTASAGWQKLAAQMQSVVSQFSSVGRSATGGWQQLASSVAQLSKPLSSFVSQISSSLSSLNSLKSGLSSMSGPLSKLAQDFGSGVSAAGGLASKVSFLLPLLTVLTGGSAGAAEGIALLASRAATIAPILTTLGSAIGATVSKLSATGSTTTQASASWKAFADTLTQIAPSLGGLVSKLVSSVPSLERLRTTLGSLGAPLSALIAQFQSSGTGVAGFGEKVAAALGTLRSLGGNLGSVSTLFTSTAEKLSGVASVIGRVGPAWKELTGTVNQAVPSLTSFFSHIAQGFPALDSLRSGLSSLGAPLVSLFSHLQTGGQGFSGFAGKISAALSSITSFGSSLGSVSSLFQSAGAKLSSVSGVLGGIGSAWAHLKDATTQAAAPLSSFFSNVTAGFPALQNLKAGLSSLSAPFASLLSSFQSSGQGTTGFTARIGSLLSTLSAVGSNLSGVSNTFSGFGSKLAALAPIFQGLTNVTGVASGAWRTLTSAATTAANSVGAFGQKIAGGGLTSALNTAKNAVTGLGSSFAGSLKNVGSLGGVLTTLLSPLKGVASATAGAASSLTNFGGLFGSLNKGFASLPGVLGGGVTTLGQMGVQFAALGAVFPEIIHGIEGMVEKFHDFVKESVDLAARIEVLNHVLLLTAANMNYSVGAAEAQVDSIRKLNITHKEAIETTLQFMRAQLQLSDATKLTRAAQDLAVVSGQNSSQALGTLIEAIQTNREVLLRQFGIVKTLPQIFELYASSINRSAASLSTLERQQAILNTILTEASKVSGAYVTALDDASKRQASLARLWEDTKEQVGTGLVPALLLIVKAMETFLGLAKAVPTELYAFVAVTVTVGGSLIGLTAAVRGLIAGFVALQTAQSGALLGLRTFLVTLVTSPIGIVALAIAALAGAFTFLAIRQTAAAKEAINHAQSLAGESEKAKNLQTDLQKLSDLRTRANELQTGTIAPSQAELGQYTFLDEATKKRLATQRAVDNAVDAETQLLHEAALANVNIDQYLDSEHKHLIDIAGAQKAINAEVTKWQSIEHASLPDLEKIRQAKEQDYRDEIKRSQDLVKVRANPPKSPLGQINEAFSRDILRGDLFKNLDEQAEASDIKIQALAKEIENLTKKIEELRTPRSGQQIVPINTETTLNQFKQLENQISEFDKFRRTGIQPTNEEKLALENSAKSLNTFYVDQLKNLEAVQSRGKELAKTDDARRVLASDVAKTIQDQGRAEQLLKNTAGDTHAALKAQHEVANLLAEDIARANQHQAIYGNNVQSAAQTLLDFEGQRNTTKELLNRNEAESLRLQAAQIQAQNAILNAHSKTSVEVARVYENERRRLAIESAIAIKQDAVAGQAAVIANNAAIQVNRQEQIRAAIDAQANIQRNLVSADEARTQAVGQTQQQQLANLHLITAAEIAQIKASTTDRLVAESEITKAVASEEGKRLAIFIENNARRLQLETETRKSLETPIQIRVEQGQATGHEILQLKAYYEAQAQSDIAEYTNRTYLQAKATQGEKAATDALNAYRKARYAEVAQQELDLDRKVQESRLRMAEEYFRVLSEAGQLSQTTAEADLRQLESLNAINRVAQQLHLSETQRQQLIRQTTSELQQQKTITEAQQKAEAAANIIRSTADPVARQVVPRTLVDQSKQELDAQESQLKQLARIQSATAEQAYATGKIEAYNVALQNLNKTLETLRNLSQAQRSSLEALSERAASAQRILQASGQGVIGDPQMIRQARQDLKEIRAEMESLAATQKEAQKEALTTGNLDAYRDASDKLMQTLGAIAQVQFSGPITSLQQLFEVIQTGGLQAVTTLQILAAGFEAMTPVASAAFEAIGAGADVGKAAQQALSGLLKSLSSYALKQAAFYFAVAAADAANPALAALQGRTVGQDLISASEWLAAAAVLGISGGAVGGGGSAGGGGATASGGPNEATGKAAGLQQVSPTKTQTDVTGDNIVRLQQGLVVQGRQIQAAGEQFTNLGSQIYQFINTEKQLTQTRHQTEIDFANRQALQFDRLINSGGITGIQFQALDAFSQAVANKLRTQNQEGLQGTFSPTIATGPTAAGTQAVKSIADQGVSTSSSHGLGTQGTGALAPVVSAADLATLSNAINGGFTLANINLQAINANIGNQTRSTLTATDQLRTGLIEALAPEASKTPILPSVTPIAGTQTTPNASTTPLPPSFLPATPATPASAAPAPNSTGLATGASSLILAPPADLTPVASLINRAIESSNRDLAGTLSPQLLSIHDAVNQNTQTTTSTMLNWLQTNQSENRTNSADVRDTFATMSENISGKLISLNVAQANASDTTNSILRGIHQETIKANEKGQTPVIVSPTISIDGQELAGAVTTSISGNDQFIRSVTGGVVTAVKQNSNRRDLGRAVGNGGI